MKLTICLAAIGMLAGLPAVAGAQNPRPAPREQPATAPAPEAPTGAMSLGQVRIPRTVLADGKPLRAGTYEVRLTEKVAEPAAPGATPALARWVEFVRAGSVEGREVVTIVPQAEIQVVAQDRPPAANTSRAEVLRGGEYLRVWINREGHHYLLHLPIEGDELRSRSSPAIMRHHYLLHLPIEGEARG